MGAALAGGAPLLHGRGPVVVSAGARGFLLALALFGAWLVPVSRLGAQSGRAAPAGARSFVIIVNSANPLTSMRRDQIARIFLKKTHGWPNGRFTLPVDLAEESPVREAFSVAILGKSVSAIQAYWQQQIFSGHDVPPLHRRADSEVVDFVRSNAEAIGYVRGGETLAGVRVLRVVD